MVYTDASEEYMGFSSSDKRIKYTENFRADLKDKPIFMKELSAIQVAILKAPHNTVLEIRSDSTTAI